MYQKARVRFRIIGPDSYDEIRRCNEYTKILGSKKEIRRITRRERNMNHGREKAKTYHD